MANIWLKIVKPGRSAAKWLLFLVLISVVVATYLGYFDSVRQVLDTPALTLRIGSFGFSAYTLLSSIIAIALVFWTTAIIVDTVEHRISGIQSMRAANRALVLKLAQIVIYLVAFLVGLDFVGIDLTTLTVFSGAVGIGLGFGLQKIASNFISGLILLMEKSIEEGDLIELSDGTFGYIRRASARYTLVETFDSKEILVPNEDLITSRVVNWTFSNSSARIEIELGVAYDSDIDLAHDLILAAAREHPRCAIKPEPACFLRSFGDSSVNFILHFWVEDVTLGRWPTQSEVMFSIWRKFKDNGIEIPFPQRDLHIKGPLNFNRSGEATPSKEG
ncbi:MAG: mechanosensitive ion channel [OM182 bacterium]